MAAGFQLVLGANNFQLPGQTDLIPTARDETDAADLVKQYLSDPERRIADAFKAQTYTLKHHTYSKRLEVIIERFKDLRNNQDKISILKSSINSRHSEQRISTDSTSVLHVVHNLIGLERNWHRALLILLLVGKSQCFRSKVLAMAPKDGTQLAVMVYKNGRPINFCQYWSY